jgi:hypothetical protein
VLVVFGRGGWGLAQRSIIWVSGRVSGVDSRVPRKLEIAAESLVLSMETGEVDVVFAAPRTTNGDERLALRAGRRREVFYELSIF